MAKKTISLISAGLVAGFTIAWLITPQVEPDCSDVVAELNAAESLLASYENEIEESFARDAVVSSGALFRADVREIIAAITNRYATNRPYFASKVARLSTNLGAFVEFGLAPKGVTSTVVRFRESARDHGLEVVRIVAFGLHIPGDSAMETARFASFDDWAGGVIIFRHANGFCGTTTDDSSGHREVAVHFTPTK